MFTIRRILILIFLFISFSATAADYYIVPGGTGNGSDWTNAADIPDGWSGQTYCSSSGAVWTRGTTYWVAGSDTPYSYGFCIRLTSGDEAGYITIKKANATDNSGVAGWSADYGTKQAVIPRVIMSQSATVNNVIIDGVTGSGTSGYGFKFNAENVDPIIAIGESGRRPSGVTISNVEISPSSVIGSYSAIGGYCSIVDATTDSPNLMIQNNYIHDVGALGIHTTSSSWITIQDNILERTGQYNNATHKEIIKHDGGSNITIRRNILRDWQGYSITGGIVLSCDATAGVSYANIYNNLMYYTDADYTGKTGGNRAIGGLASCGALNLDYINIYNNTFYGISESGASNILPDFTGNTISNSEVKNNLFYNCAGLSAIGMTGVTKDYNWFYQTDNYTDRQAHDVSGSADPFTNSSTYDFTLNSSTTAINKGDDLSASFTTDYLGNARPTGALTWDIGSYEYGAGGVDPVDPPSTYTVTVSLSGAGGELSVSGERSVVATESISITATRHNGWNGAWSGTCPNVASCTVPDEGKTAVCSVTPTENCTAIYTATSVPLLN